MYCSWGSPFETHKKVISQYWRNNVSQMTKPELYLAYGCGRSYGDVCLNDSNTLIDTSKLNHLIKFDRDTGFLRVESGVTLDYLLQVIIPHGWFFPVTPGTRFVSIGGMVANDVHGKNHHRSGTFGCHIEKLELMRSNGEVLMCSPMENKMLFNATIGGLGLTGLITWVEFKLKKIKSKFISANTTKIYSLQHYFELENNQKSEYSVAWIDTLASGSEIGRGVYYAGEHALAENGSTANDMCYKHSVKNTSIPFNLPSRTLNKYTVKLFNALYIRNAVLSNKNSNSLINYEKYFYPLDNIFHWNRMYGKSGLFQHQCVVPEQDANEALTEMLKVVSIQDNASFLSVLKKFGTIESPGMLSFPRPGYTLAMDFSRRGNETIKLLASLDSIVSSVGGAIYPAKDAVMSKNMFTQSYSKLNEFVKYIDPKFSSSFWRRVSNKNGC